ncbi:hypothetical protein ACHAQA_006056 [Verticillium albo-atrum]
MRDDIDGVRQRLENARQTQPERFADYRDDWLASGLTLLNTYLKNRLSDPQSRKISKRNKRFQVSFGEELWPLFRALGFVEQTLENDGVEEDYFVPEPLELSSPPTEIGTLRSFVEDMRSEVENRIMFLGQQSPASPHNDDAVERLEKALHCYKWPQNKSFHVQNINALDTEFSLLGVLPTFEKSLTLFGYYKQCAAWPANRKLLTNALANNARRLGDDELMLQATVEESKIDLPGDVGTNDDNDDTTMVWQAATFFNLDNIQAVGDHVVVGRFKQKLQEDPAQADIAKEFLLVLGRSKKSDRLIEAAQGPMSLKTAMDWLEATDQFDDEFIEMMVNTKLKSHAGNQDIKTESLEALDTIARARNSDRLLQFAQQVMLSQDNELTAAQAAIVRYDLPVGLKNIGNTCYLNSILQYLYTVKPVRDLLLNFEDYRLDLSEESIAARRIGSNRMPLTRPDAVVSFACAEELHKLFTDLLKSDQVAVRPTQRLANAALFVVEAMTTDEAPTEQSSSQPKQLPEVMGAQFPAPPPLPARPPPSVPGGQTDHVEHVEHVERIHEARDGQDVDMVNVSVDAVSDAASTGSSKTLIGDSMDVDLKSEQGDGKDTGGVLPSIETDGAPFQGNGDTKMAGTDSADPTNDARVLAALETQKRSTGTEQQDVGEVLGRILDRLQGAIKHTSVTADGIQDDCIMQVFYIKTMTRNQKDGNESQVQVTLDRYVSAYPAEDKATCSIYDALSKTFDLEHVEDSGFTRYMGIECSPKPPSIFQVMIQRTTSMGRKEDGAVVVGEKIYLDRFVDAAPGSQLYKYRSAGWTLQKRLEKLQKVPAKPKVENSASINRFIQHGLDSPTDAPTDASEDSSLLLSKQPSSKFSFPCKPFTFQSNTTETGHEEDDGAHELARFSTDELPSREQIQEMTASKVTAHLARLSEIFDGLQKHEYLLHAVICHSGQLNSGHYWVYIRDFAAGIWRKYNDETVTEYTKTEDVLRLLNGGGDPYYLCYVRADEVQALIDVPQRRPLAATGTDEVAEARHLSTDGFSALLPSQSSGLHSFPPAVHQNSPVDEQPPAYQENGLA